MCGRSILFNWGMKRYFQSKTTDSYQQGHTPPALCMAVRRINLGKKQRLLISTEDFSAAGSDYKWRLRNLRLLSEREWKPASGTNHPAANVRVPTKWLQSTAAPWDSAHVLPKGAWDRCCEEFPLSSPQAALFPDGPSGYQFVWSNGSQLYSADSLSCSCWDRMQTMQGWTKFVLVQLTVSEVSVGPKTSLTFTSGVRKGSV